MRLEVRNVQAHAQSGPLWHDQRSVAHLKRLLEERVDAEMRDLSARLATLEAVSRARNEAMDEQDDA